MRASPLSLLAKSQNAVVKWPTRWSARRGRIGSAGSGASVYVYVRNRLRPSGSAAGVDGVGVPGGGGVTGGAGSFGTAKCWRTVMKVPCSVARTRSMDVLARSSVYPMR